jgi:hypothetical protein
MNILIFSASIFFLLFYFLHIYFFSLLARLPALTDYPCPAWPLQHTGPLGLVSGRPEAACFLLHDQEDSPMARMRQNDRLPTTTQEIPPPNPNIGLAKSTNTTKYTQLHMIERR